MFKAVSTKKAFPPGEPMGRLGSTVLRLGDRYRDAVSATFSLARLSKLSVISRDSPALSETFSSRTSWRPSRSTTARIAYVVHSDPLGNRVVENSRTAPVLRVS